MKQIFSILALSIALATTAFSQSANMQTVMNNYAAFGKGDIPAIIASFADDCLWVHAGDPTVVPFAGTFKGKAGLGQFFDAVGKSTQIVAFEPANFTEKGNMVMNTTHIVGKTLSTGKTADSIMNFTWTFDATGKVVKFEAAGNTAALEDSFKK